MTNALLGYVPNALATSAGLDAELNTLITRYGKAEVRKASVKLTAGKKGRKQERDWPIIGPEICRLDALAWIKGQDPFQLRSNYAIAQDFAQRYPGQSITSTHRRIMRKLKEKRQWFFQNLAWSIASDELPFRQYFEVMSRIENRDERWTRILSNDFDLRTGQLESYRSYYGEPDDEMRFPDIEAKLAEIRTNALSGFYTPKRGIFGNGNGSLLSRYLPKATSDKIE
jgi:hypothetical protein